MYGPCLSSIVAGRPHSPATRHRLGEPLPHQQADKTQAAPSAGDLSPFTFRSYTALPRLSASCTLPKGTFPRVTHPSASIPQCGTDRLACLRHAASVHPEPGSNSQKESSILKLYRIYYIGYHFPEFKILLAKSQST